MTKIIVTNKFSKIEDDSDVDFLLKLNKFLSFKYVGAEFTPAFKNYGWDGREYLLSSKLMFMSGLLDNVIEFYKSNNRDVEIIDNRKKLISGDELDITTTLNKLGIIPYDYQISSVQKAIDNDRMIFKHATGSGKSITAALIAAKFNKPTIIYVISKELLFQFHNNFSTYFCKKIGIVGAGRCEIEDITIVSIWTLGRMLGLKKQDILVDTDDSEDDDYTEQNKIKALEFIKKCKVHLFDECHISGAKTIQNIYKAIDAEKIFGFSGTPVRDDGADLLITGVFGNVIDDVPASDLIKRKILAKPYIKFIYNKGNANFTDSYSTVYSNNVISNDYRNGIIARETKNLLDKNYQVLILFRSLKHGKILFDLFKKQGIKCEMLNGKDTEEKRQLVKSNLLNKKNNCLLASMIYDIGIDIVTLNALVLAGSGKSSVKTIQRLGRILRDGKNKPYVAVVDFIDDVKFLKKHSKIRKEIYETEPEFEIFVPKNVKF